ncbi:hypothetical protein L6164_002838 [Bauhinia variegata]|uniref:Uncharacterized protein n=1 Tax=Bauhinia variegata TaxID=167791 RepID=A0ACB9PZF1_BAUVA|nr:hypothetical protein L6164_002838 [Bauhinia variegata]
MDFSGQKQNAKKDVLQLFVEKVHDRVPVLNHWENHIIVKNKAIVGVCASAVTVLVMLIAIFIYQPRRR